MKLSTTLFFTTLAAAALAMPPTSGFTTSISNITCVPGAEGDNACILKGWNSCCTETKVCVKGDGLKLKREWSCNGKSIPCDLNKDGDRLCEKEACTSCNETGFCEGRATTDKKRESVDCSQQIPCAADLDSHMVCQTHGCGYHYCDAEARVCRKLGDELKRAVFACNDIYCTPGSAGNASCAGQKCGYCSAVTSKCAEFPALAVNVSLPSSPQLGQEVQEKRQSVSCNNIYCTPGEPGDKSCKDQGCGYCNWRTSKCAKFPPEKRQSMACNNIYCTPGPEGDQSCKLVGCGSCRAEASKCM